MIRTAGLRLFVYGTLLDADLRRLVWGAADSLAPEPAYAAGWRAVHVPRQTYPMLRRAPMGGVHGLLLSAPSATAWCRLIAYEGKGYQLGRIMVINEAGQWEQAAVFLATHGAGIRNWCFDVWQRRHKRRSMVMVSRALRCRSSGSGGGGSVDDKIEGN